MAWTCTACEFTANEDGQEACVACGSERPEEEEQQQQAAAESAPAEEKGDGGEDDGGTTSGGGEDGPEVVVIELPAKEKLGVKLMPPKDGVIDHGLAIDNINNPLLENKVQAGDLIVAIGGQNVDGMGFSDAIDLIRKMPRPLAISFEIDEARRQEVVRAKFQQNKDNDLDTELTTYAVVFDNGPMGLNLEEAVRYGIDGAVVRALKGQAKTSGMISIGDIVYKVNETDVLCMPYLEVMNVLRNATAPKTLQFVPKDKLADVQRVNSRHSESFRLRESTSHVKQKLMSNPRIVKDDGNEADDNQSIAQLILDNQAATIKKGRMYKQGRVMRNWKSRYFVLSVSKVEYFKSPSSTTSRGEMSFLNHRCTVRSLPATGDVVCRSPNVTAEYVLELRVDDRRMVMACTSESDKKGWMDAIKLAIDASKTVNRTQNLGESLREAKALRTQRTESISMDGTFLDRNAGGRLSQFNYEAFSTPVVHVGVLSATNLTKSGSSVNALCEVTVGAETFKTSVVKNLRSPVWKQDNSASFEAPTDDMVVEIRIFDEHLFRATELIATLSIPLKSLPNMQKTTKKYPLALGSRSAGAVLTLSLEYVNKQKAFEEDQERGRLGDDLNSNGMMNERDEMVKIKAEAQMAADEATHHAARAQEEAHMLLEQSRQKAEAAMAAAREEQREGKAAVEKAMAEAARAKEEAEKQLAEARRAQEEAQKLIEANRRIQESDVQGPSIYAVYRRMVQDGHSNDEVKKKMQEDGIDENGIQAFFDGINSYDEKIRALQAEVEKLKRSRSSRPKDEPRAADMLANLDISSDQVKLLRRLLKLEKQLQQAGIAVAADIPYEEAMAKVQEISKRMQEIGSADVTHPDPAIQKQLREEYYRLEQDMEKYNTALMLTDEYAAEEARKEREWEDENYDENVKALKAIRRMMPVDVKKMSEADLQTMKSPTGKTLPRDVARKFKRTNVLELIRMNPADIAKNHPSLLENLRVTGLTVTERRALHMHLREIAETWKSQQGEEMTKKKYEWFKTLKETFKTVVNSYNKHVKQYGPEDNHPYATRDDPDIGCPMIGKQCPIKANKNPAYDQDLGYPDGDVYMESTVQKGNPDDAGARALAEAQELARAKLANSRADALKKHYRNVRLVAEANGACELIDTSLDQIENRQLLWFQARLKRRLERTETAATIKVELAEFGELVNEIRLASLKFAERSGMNLSGKRNAALDAKDTRSTIECNLILLYCDAVADCFDGMDERMDEVKASDKRLRSAIPVIRGLLKDLGEKSRTTLASLEKGPPVNRRVKTRTEIMKEAKEKNSAAAPPAESEAAEEAPGPGRAPHPMMAARGRGRGRGGGRDGLFAAIKGRGGRGGDDDGPPGPPTDFLASIRGRGRGNPGGPGRGDLFSAIKARGGGGGGGGDGGGRGGDLIAAIRGRGRGGGMPGGGRGDFLAAIAARKKD